MKKKAFALILSLCMLLSLIPLAAMPANAEGEIPLDAGVSPASGATYTIANAEQLRRLSDIVKSGNECSGATFVLTADIVLNDGIFAADANGEPLYDGEPVSAENQPKQWVPIGLFTSTLDRYFKGIFDGNSHTVSGLFFDNSLQIDVGLFGKIDEGAQIKNVGVINSYIRGNGYVGGVCGMNIGAITSCYNTGSVDGSDSVGGVCGRNNGAITSCYNTGSVSGSETVGGVCGTNIGAITSSYNTGSVSSEDGFVGGVCGENYHGKITSCYNTGSVDGSGRRIGGVCGANNSAGAITSCYNTGSVSGSEYVGGVCGMNNNAGAITNCYSTGSVSGGSGVGGVCGYNDDGTITSCYYLNGTAYGGISGEDAAGQAEKRAEAEMKAAAFVAAINNGGSAFMPSFYGLNGGYPLLRAFYNLEGDGSAEAPYLIYNGEQLGLMSYLVNNENANYGNKQYKLMADITLNDGVFAADANGEPVFKGKAVSAENQPEQWVPAGNNSSAQFAGVFDGNSHTVSGLFFDNAKQYCVGLFGRINSGTQIKNVGVINSYLRGKSDVGGVCGYNIGAITSCYNTGIVRGDISVGGVCGASGGAITSCYNTGSVQGTGNYVGGVCGYNDEGTMENCSNAGSAYGVEEIGGVCGRNNSGTITNCNNAGNVDGSGRRIGGVCGYSTGTTENCCNTGIVGSSGSSGNHIGGVCGHSTGAIKNCHNNGNVSSAAGYVGGVCGMSGAITNCYNAGNISGMNYVGGVCGASDSMSNCYNTGAVSGDMSVGGVCGACNGDLTYCYNTGSVSGTDKKIGGVCGMGQRIASTYNTGIVTGTEEETGDIFGTVSAFRCDYFLGASSGFTYNGTRKTAAEMKDADFVAEINDGGSAFILSFNGLNGGYPMLKALCEFTGEGTAASPYLIYNANQLNYMSYLVNNHNANYGNKEYKLMADITLNDGVFAADETGEPLYDDKAVSAENQPEQWVPIGKSSTLFTGVFDGNSHTVSGLFFDNTKQSYVGLFGNTGSGAQIKNVGVINSYIRGSNEVGGVCGMNIGAITSCYNTGCVSGISLVGGVCGDNIDAITSSYNTGIVRGDLNVGGVCGYSEGTITSCCNTGSVSCFGSIIGGVCGNNNNRGAITSCYNTGSVDGSSYVGGVCGGNYGAINNCYYLDSSCGWSEGGTSKAENEFNSGEVCYLLNSEKTDGTQAFYQNLGTGADKYPALDNTHGTVYSGYDRCFISYSNTELSETPSAHTYTVFKENGDGTHTRACTVCDETAEGHFDTADCTAAEDAAVAATCYSTGLTAGSHCPVCGYVITAQEDTEKIAHTYGEWESNNNGTHTKVCTVCDETADDHSVTDTCSFGEWSTVTASTCTAKGSESHACVDCGFSEIRETDLAEHEWETYFTIDEEATCANPGSKSIHCKNCPEKSNITEIAIAEHSYGAWVSDGSGKHTHICTACPDGTEGHAETVSCVLTATVTPPTCTAGGCTTHACADCGYSYTDSETAATEHSFGSWHFEGGSIVRTCENCGTNESLFTVVWLSFVKIFNAAWLGLVNVFNKLWNVIPK